MTDHKLDAEAMVQGYYIHQSIAIWNTAVAGW